jgi:hypothetical protein
VSFRAKPKISKRTEKLHWFKEVNQFDIQRIKKEL